jgi:DNA mismatch repair ATPase MutS
VGVLDQCVTGAGARLLAKWVQEPLRDVAVIGERQRRVGGLVTDGLRRKEVAGR